MKFPGSTCPILDSGIAAFLWIDRWIPRRVICFGGPLVHLPPRYAGTEQTADVIQIQQNLRYLEVFNNRTRCWYWKRLAKIFEGILGPLVPERAW